MTSRSEKREPKARAAMAEGIPPSRHLSRPLQFFLLSTAMNRTSDGVRRLNRKRRRKCS